MLDQLTVLAIEIMRLSPKMVLVNSIQAVNRDNPN
jgi:hypothetical protein